MTDFNIWKALFGDPTLQTGLAGMLGIPSAPASATSLPAPPIGQGTSSTNPVASATTPASSPFNLQAFFQPQTGILGNSLMGNVLRGALSGLGGSTGYTGLAALGQGFNAANQASSERQRNQLTPIMAGQEYQKGQQGLIAGNLANIWALQRVNNFRAHYGLPPVSMVALLANPSLVNDPTGNSQSAAGASAQASLGPTAAPVAVPQGNQGLVGTVPPQAPITVSQLGPPATGLTPQTPEQSNGMPSPTVVPGNAAAAGGQMPPAVLSDTGAPPPTPASAPANTPLPPSQAGLTGPATAAAPYGTDSAGRPLPPPSPISQTGTDAVVTAYQQAAQTAYDLGDMEKGDELTAKAAEYANQVQQAGNVKTSQLAAEQGAPQTQWSDVNKLANDYSGNEAVRVMGEVRPAFRSASAAFQRKDLPSDADLTYATLKLWNPNGGNLRPSTLEQVDEIKGLPAYIRKGLQAVIGGQGLTAEMRNALMASARDHYKNYLREYDAVVRNYRARSKLLPNAGSVQENQWRSDYTSPIPQAAIDQLRKMPSTAGQFDEIFGQGAAEEELLRGGG